MLGIREVLSNFDKREVEILRQTLERTSNDRAFLVRVIVGGGSLALILMVFALHLLARSITGPLVTLAKTVENRRGETVPEVRVLERGDEIGDLTRVMHNMSQQIRDYIQRIKNSETELRSLNLDLSTSESKYRGILDYAPFGIFTAKHRAVIFCNRHNCILAGRNPDEDIAPETMWESIHPEDRKQILRSFSEAIANEVPFERVFRFLHPNGTVRKVLSRAVPIRSVPGSEVIYQGFNIDITALEQMRERLSRAERLATLGQVAAGIAHEIRNPLVGIGSTTSLLIEELHEEDTRREDLTTILKETRRLDRIVTQIVEYARPRDLVPGSFEVNPLIEETMNLVREPVEQKGVHVTYDFSPSLAPIYADRDQIKQVLLNGIQNALEAAPFEGTIRINLTEEERGGEKGLLIGIHDNGKGIAPVDLPKIFEPFFTTGKCRGTGLGLPICQNIIDAHGGDIKAGSQAGDGTSLTIWLPISSQVQTSAV